MVSTTSSKGSNGRFALPRRASPSAYACPSAKAMQVAPHRCIVIEDSPAGIVAARRAGMRVLAFTGGSHIGPAGLRPAIERLRPDAIFGSMSEVPWILERLGGRKKAS